MKKDGSSQQRCSVFGVSGGAWNGGYDSLLGERDLLTRKWDLIIVGCFFDVCWDGFISFHRAFRYRISFHRVFQYGRHWRWDGNIILTRLTICWVRLNVRARDPTAPKYRFLGRRFSIAALDQYWAFRGCGRCCHYRWRQWRGAIGIVVVGYNGTGVCSGFRFQFQLSSFGQEVFDCDDAQISRGSWKRLVQQSSILRVLHSYLQRWSHPSVPHEKLQIKITNSLGT